jgi:sec-independent protein translocase protein TatB
MFDIGWSEMMVILVVALIVIGPKDLPRVARNVGRWVGKARGMAREFQSQLEDMAREAELDKVKQEIEKAGRTDVKRTIEKTIDPKGELGRAFDPSAENGARPAAPTSPEKPSSAAKEPTAGTKKVAATKKPAARKEPAKSTGARPNGAAEAPAGEAPEAASGHERVPAETN